MTNNKTGLIRTLGTFLLGATSLIGLVGCEAGPQTNRGNVYSQPNHSKEDDGTELPMALLSGMLSVGGFNGMIPSNASPLARELTGTALRGAGTGITEYSKNQAVRSSGAKVQVNVDAAEQPSSAQPPEVYAPVQKTLDPRLLPEYDIKKLEEEYDKKVVPGMPLYGGIFSVFASEKTVDLDGDHKLAFNEFLGKRRNFERDKPVRIIALFKGCETDTLLTPIPCQYQVSCEVFNENGESVIGAKQDGKQESYDQNEVMTFNISGLGPGIYSARCTYLNSNDDRGKKSERGTVFQVLE